MSKNNMITPVVPSSVNSKSSNRSRLRVSPMRYNNMGLSIFHYVFMILFIISFYYAVIGREFNLSFTGLLQIFEQAPSIPTDWITTISSATITGDWGVFEPVKTFLNSFTGIISFLMYIAVGGAQIIVYFGYFLGAILGY